METTPQPESMKILSVALAKKYCTNHKKSIRANAFEYNLEDEKEYNIHANMVRNIGNNYMEREFRSFEIDERNRNILKFLVYYMNDCKLAKEVFPDENYCTSKNLLFIGNVGTGKTMLMQIFSEYGKALNLKKKFFNISTTQMMNYYKINSHIDKYTYNEQDQERKFEGNPVNVCLNDIGLDIENQKSYGTNLSLVMDEFLYARYELYQNNLNNYHLTSNLSIDEFKLRFEDRLVDRFKSFNIIVMSGESRRK